MLLTLLAASPAAAREPRPAMLLVVQTTQERARLLGPVEEQLVQSKRFRVVLMQALLPLMQQADDKAGLLTRARELMEQGRQAMVALDQTRARAALEQARDLLESGYVRHYDPRLLAQVHLLLGVIALEQLARPDLARQEFVAVHHLDRGFTLDAHYSPGVRTAFEEAGRNLPPRPAPPPAEVARLAKLASARAAVVLTVQGAGEQMLVQGSVFLASRSGYTTVESRLVDPTDKARLRRQAKGLGLELRLRVEPNYPKPKPPEKKIKKRKELPPPPPPPPTPWYKRWYVWTGVGVAVAAAIVLPLTLRTKTSDVVVELP